MDPSTCLHFVSLFLALRRIHTTMPVVEINVVTSVEMRPSERRGLTSTMCTWHCLAAWGCLQDVACISLMVRRCSPLHFCSSLDVLSYPASFTPTKPLVGSNDIFMCSRPLQILRAPRPFHPRRHLSRLSTPCRLVYLFTTNINICSISVAYS